MYSQGSHGWVGDAAAGDVAARVYQGRERGRCAICTQKWKQQSRQGVCGAMRKMDRRMWRGWWRFGTWGDDEYRKQKAEEKEKRSRAAGVYYERETGCGRWGHNGRAGLSLDGKRQPGQGRLRKRHTKQARGRVERSVRWLTAAAESPAKRKTLHPMRCESIPVAVSAM
ncbi:uncharacterized protein BKA78DRAFT_19173 [Phyllosticta capitalensis]|uniref:uncharacterized protein n=1 Tax=Phyllosticta capitalensis TaxID=121624 RepID=UPI00312DCA85